MLYVIKQLRWMEQCKIRFKKLEGCCHRFKGVENFQHRFSWQLYITTYSYEHLSVAGSKLVVNEYLKIWIESINKIKLVEVSYN